MKESLRMYYTGGSILLDNMQPLMSKEDIKGTQKGELLSRV